MSRDNDPRRDMQAEQEMAGREKYVPAALKQLAYYSTAILSAIGDLEKRLSPVLSTEVAEERSNVVNKVEAVRMDKEDVGKPQMALYIEEQTANLERAQHHLNRLFSKLEI